LFNHELFDQTVPYQALSADPDEFPGRIISSDLAAGKIDVALVWGPIGGYFARQSKQPLRVVPFVTTAQLKFDYSLAMGVRQPDRAWRDTVDAVIARRQTEIDHILDEYAVPRLELSPPQTAAGAKP
jgi:ABC-type amino acid transport substrate-binding protein